MSETGTLYTEVLPIKIPKNYKPSPNVNNFHKYFIRYHIINSYINGELIPSDLYYDPIYLEIHTEKNIFNYDNHRIFTIIKYVKKHKPITYNYLKHFDKINTNFPKLDYYLNYYIGCICDVKNNYCITDKDLYTILTLFAFRPIKYTGNNFVEDLSLLLAEVIYCGIDLPNFNFERVYNIKRAI